MLAVLVGAIATPAEVVRADPPHVTTEAEYQRLVTEAIREFDAGRFDEARAIFREAHRLQPSARTYRGIGMTSFELSDYVTAVVAFRAALADERRPLSADQRAQVVEWLAQSDRFVGRYRVHLEPADAHLLLDGEAPVLVDAVLLVNPGSHELRIEADGYLPRLLQLAPQSGTERELTIHLETIGAPPSAMSTSSEVRSAAAEHPVPPTVAADDGARRSHRRRAWGIGLTVTGIAVAGLGMTTGALLLRQTDQSLEGHCGASVGLPDDRCVQDSVVADATTEARRARTLAFASLGFGAVLTGTGLGLWLAGRHRDGPRPSISPSVACGPNGCRADVTGRF